MDIHIYSYYVVLKSINPQACKLQKVETKVERSVGDRRTRECREWTRRLTRFCQERTLVRAEGYHSEEEEGGVDGGEDAKGVKRDTEKRKRIKEEEREKEEMMGEG